jgi:hypothetical protein
LRFPFSSDKGKQGSIGGRKVDIASLGASEHFEWRAEAGNASVDNPNWIKENGIPYLEEVYAAYKNEILKLGDVNKLPIKVVIRPSSECSGGISGATANGDLSYCAGNWSSNEFCYGILAHELCNLLTGERVSSGWPVLWWANHRSPFPTMIANQALRRLTPEYYRRWGDYNDPLVAMFEKFYGDYPDMFPKMFRKMVELKVVLSRFQEPYLSHVLYYFMFYATGTQQLSKQFVVPPMPPINPKTIYDIEGKFKLGILNPSAPC